MKTISNIMKDFWNDESGLTAVEYAIAGSLVVGGLVAAFEELGTATKDTIGDLCTAAGGSDCDGAS
ncbi:Flp family type IVb pilin [Bowmanella pacifica]|uniref:Flp family type IVb pilin n=1 Tax=Bowmanella pacifica TaxID=502051 RepID=A0A917YSC8_9ALTE|nr:Flp family type IVb pilin [Bowmanella pacifica]GGO65072.1 hypothetical protein GCM10010982_06000 [Bowmanella pacifica]